MVRLLRLTQNCEMTPKMPNNILAFMPTIFPVPSLFTKRFLIGDSRPCFPGPTTQDLGFLEMALSTIAMPHIRMPRGRSVGAHSRAALRLTAVAPLFRSSHICQSQSRAHQVRDLLPESYG